MTGLFQFLMTCIITFDKCFHRYRQIVISVSVGVCVCVRARARRTFELSLSTMRSCGFNILVKLDPLDACLEYLKR